MNRLNRNRHAGGMTIQKNVNCQKLSRKGTRLIFTPGNISAAANRPIPRLDSACIGTKEAKKSLKAGSGANAWDRVDSLTDFIAGTSGRRNRTINAAASPIARAETLHPLKRAIAAYAPW